ERQGPDPRLPGRRRRLRPVRDGALRPEHRRRAAALPGDVPQPLLRRPLAEPVDGADPAGTRALAPEPGRTDRGRPARGQAGDRPPLAGRMTRSKEAGRTRSLISNQRRDTMDAMHVIQDTEQKPLGTGFGPTTTAREVAAGSISTARPPSSRAVRPAS